MLVVVSPAKSLDMDPVDIKPTAPDFQEDAVRLSKTAKNLSLKDLKGLMDISDDLARLNRDRFAAFAAAPDAAMTKP
ncbi:MAG: YaaA family protein, partial [Paracoccaceae bacterium]|nr:YaaA family protein [Paracoccaceae bacterium]